MTKCSCRDWLILKGLRWNWWILLKPSYSWWVLGSLWKDTKSIVNLQGIVLLILTILILKIRWLKIELTWDQELLLSCRCVFDWWKLDRNCQTGFQLWNFVLCSLGNWSKSKSSHLEKDWKVTSSCLFLHLPILHTQLLGLLIQLLRCQDYLERQ